ncbi:hypothetical protein RCO27_12965 [Sphingosinicella sp. LHD-64]|uniref:hypothetical protein n=1 Tax=Sphingosinicella sp. LHD-64 TaxID=3072139 RepID=UPI00280D7EEC|nr:hypothetical protein [Sphingosinicella sp. LHD-64]MDQ8757135.1 hypothetical protein [Sphingosinicella sp. LHD-64]
MEPLIYVMAILGCGEGDAACRLLAVVETRYRTEAACLAATEDQLLRRDDLAYPNVVAECRRAGAAAQPLRGRDIMQPEGGRLPVGRAQYAASGWFRSSR